MTHPLSQVRVVLFDVFGTIVDWRSGITQALRAFGLRHGIERDWENLADDWRRRYQPSMENVRSGRREWTILDQLHRESLEALLTEHRIVRPSEAELHDLTLAWHRLDPWPDVVAGLERIRGVRVVATLSNGNTTLLRDLAAHGGLPWDHLLGAETALAYKPRPAAYLQNVASLGFLPAQALLAAAHNGDLATAVELGFRTAFIVRPTEHGTTQLTDLKPTGDWDVVTDSVGGLADVLDLYA